MLLFKNAYATIVRNTSAANNVEVLAKTRCYIEPMDTQMIPEQVIGTNQTQGFDSVTHSIYLDLRVAEHYIPMIEDRITITGTRYGAQDGIYVIKQYSKPRSGNRLEHLELSVRFLGVKKPGDTNPANNSTNIRLGAKNV